MRRAGAAAVAAVLLLALLTLAAPAQVALADDASRPLAGTVNGSGGVEPDASCPIGLRTVSGGVGHIAHLGLAKMTASHCTPNPPFGPAPGPILGGHMTLVAANGDELYLTYYGTVEPVEGNEGDTIEGVTHFVIAGGTGRFAGATGHGDTPFGGVLHFTAPMTLHWKVLGTIGY